MTPNNTTAEVSEAMEDFLREAYSIAFDEGAESTIHQWECDTTKPPSMPHKDCKSEGSYQFIEDAKPKLLAAMQSERLKGDGEVERLREALVKCRHLFSDIRMDYTDPRSECREGWAIIDTALSPDGVSRDE